MPNVHWGFRGPLYKSKIPVTSIKLLRILIRTSLLNTFENFKIRLACWTSFFLPIILWKPWLAKTKKSIFSTYT